MWRNLLGARGISYSISPGFRRSINPLTGGKMSAVRLKLLERGFGFGRVVLYWLIVSDGTLSPSSEEVYVIVNS